MKFTFTENDKTETTNLTLCEVATRIILLKQLKKEFGFYQNDELATLKCWLYNRHRGPGMMELTKTAFLN